MAYFPNTTSIMMFEEMFCSSCIHYAPNGGGCPVMAAHFFYMHETTGDNPNGALASALNMLIPLDEKCAMYVAEAGGDTALDLPVE